MGRLGKEKDRGQVAISSGVVLVYCITWEVPRKSESGGAGLGGEYSWASYVRPVIIVGSGDCAQTNSPVRGDYPFLPCSTCQPDLRFQITALPIPMSPPENIVEGSSSR